MIKDIIIEELIIVKVDIYIYTKGGELMAYVISDECIMCGACEAECPTDSISEGDSKYEIDAETCIDCGVCASVCPVEAISPE